MGQDQKVWGSIPITGQKCRLQSHLHQPPCGVTTVNPLYLRIHTLIVVVSLI